MLFWHLYRRAHGPGLDGIGGLYAPGRWHRQGTRVVYLGGSAAIVVLEKLAHIDPATLPSDLVLSRFEGDVSCEDVLQNEVDDVHNLEQTQTRGAAFLESGSACLLRVPSVLVTYEYNFVMNPLHPDAVKIQAVEHADFGFDQRLL